MKADAHVPPRQARERRYNKTQRNHRTISKGANTGCGAPRVSEQGWWIPIVFDTIESRHRTEPQETGKNIESSGRRIFGGGYFLLTSQQNTIEFWHVRVPDKWLSVCKGVLRFYINRARIAQGKISVSFTSDWNSFYTSDSQDIHTE